MTPEVRFPCLPHRWFPDCNFLLQQKGEGYVKDVRDKTPASKKVLSTGMSTPSPN